MWSKTAVVAVLCCAASVYAAELVNINTADSATLQTLNGIGPSKAQAIIDYRDGPNGPFETIEEIMDVSGVGTATYNNIKDHITVGTSGSVATQSQTSSPTQSQTSSQTETSGAALPAPLKVEIVGTMRVFAGAGSVFDGRVYGSNGDLITTGVRYMWNFGDGAQTEGKQAFHTYQYPGTYSLELTVAYDYRSSGTRVVVDVLPAAVALVAEGDGSLTVYNQAASDMDIGLWSLVDGTTFVIPAHTVVLAGGGVRFASTVTGLAGSRSARLVYPNGNEAVSAEVSQNSPLRGQQVTAQKSASSGYAVVPADKTAEVGSPSLAKPSSDAISATQNMAAAAVSGGSVPLWTIFGALALVLGIGAAGAYFVQAKRPETSSTSEEFDIQG